MPPRIRIPSCPSVTFLTFNPSTSSGALVPTRARCAFLSTTPAQAKAQTKLRRDFFEWLNGPGAVFTQLPHAGKTNYLGAYDVKTGEPREGGRSAQLPFPMNSVFPSTPVVSDELANEVYSRVVEGGKSVRMVSAELNVSLQRVAAIVRLKTIEKRWEKEGKPIKPFLTKTIHGMLPITPLTGSISNPHEPINDLPAHPLTHTQHFVPVSESRAFTRADAGAEFGLSPADEMIPHPELITEERERGQFTPDDRRQRAQVKEWQENEAKRLGDEKRRQKQKDEEMVLDSGRWRWKIQNAETGKVGFRYGLPHEDRKKGQVKIPTRVE
ncbi:eukaryotic mitochondrial regulator protein-domain-containing protein [Terfezia claveryi]|nr:eukaryotic mitochondrial regulator protein-domain-containing protein [Terfezia claveryi]